MATLVQCVSIPRSGHHYLVKLLRGYFNAKSTNTKRMAYCEYYHCCQTRPCSMYDSNSASSVGKIHLHKSHDEYLRRYDENYEPPLEVSNQVKHLVQIRHPIPSVISDFLMINSKLRKRRLIEDQINNKGRAKSDPTPVSNSVNWSHFSIRELEYRKRFMEKWILQNPWVGSDQHYFLDYDYWIARPKETLRKIILFLCPEESIDDSLVQSTFSRRPVKPKRNPQDFEYVSTLDELDPLCAGTWQACREKLGLDN